MIVMLDEHRIAIWQLKKAYRLNNQDTEMLIQSLALQGNIFLYDVWLEAGKNYWLRKLPRNASADQKDALNNFPTPPEVQQEAFVCLAAGRLYNFLLSLRDIFSTEFIQSGISNILEAIYDNDTEQFSIGMETLPKQLYKYWSIQPYLYGSKLCKWSPQYVVPEYFDFFNDLFRNSMMVDKAAAVRLLFRLGVNFEQEVKGLSRSYVECVIAATTLEVAVDLPVEDQGVFRVPSNLWKGLPLRTVREGMQKDGFDDPVIAYVLYYWRDVAIKETLGKLMMSPRSASGKTYTRFANKLLNSAKGLTILSS